MSEQVDIQRNKTPRRNGFAIAGLVFGLFAIFTASLGIAPILAIVFSSIGLSKTKERARGKVQSWIGLILGFLYFLVFLYHQGYIR